MNIRYCQLFIFLFLSIIGFSQRIAVRRLKATDFKTTWILFEVRGSAEKKITDKVDSNTVRFTPDSVFITRKGKYYAGTWIYNDEKSAFTTNINGFSALDYCVYSGKDFLKGLRKGQKNSKIEWYKKL